MSLGGDLPARCRDCAPGLGERQLGQATDVAWGCCPLFT